MSIAALEPFPIVDTRFECRSVGRNGTDGPAFVGISSTRMLYLELRDPDLKGDDRPNFVPNAIFAKPEQTEVVLNDVQHLGTMTTVVHATSVAPNPIKKTRSRKKAKAVSPTQDVTVVAIES